MKIIYSGGWNDQSERSTKESFIFTYHQVIREAVKKGRKIVFVTLAKPDGFYNNLLFPLYDGLIDVIDSTKLKNILWNSYDGIFIPGGTGLRLLDGLKSSSFELGKLKKEIVILGDSAGAYVLSSYFYSSPYGELRGKQMEFIEGLNPQARVISIAHKSNPKYTNDILISRVNAFAKEKGLRVLTLEENEQELLQDGEFVTVEKTKLFNI